MYEINDRLDIADDLINLKLITIYIQWKMQRKYNSKWSISELDKFSGQPYIQLESPKEGPWGKKSNWKNYVQALKISCKL